MNLKKERATFALALAGTLAAGPVVAADPASYIGVAFGVSQAADLDAASINASLASIGLGAATSVDDKGTPFKIYGGHRASENFAFEAGYTSFGEFTSNSTIISGGSGSVSGKWSGYSLDLNVLGLIPVGESISLFGKAGIGIWNLDFDISASGPGGSLAASESESGVSPILGFGAMFRLSPVFSVRADWERHFSIGDSSTTGDSDVDLITVGVQYHF